MSSRAPRLPIVGVMGDGTDSHETLAAPVGRWLATRGVHLLTGGGDGVMAAVSRAFWEVPGRQGLVLGVLKGPSDDGRRPADEGNDWVEVPIRTHLPLSGKQGTDPRSRNHINVLTADLVVVLPGGPGTRSEAELAVAYGRLALAFWDTGLPPDWPRMPCAKTFDEFVALAGPTLARLVEELM